MKKKSNQKFTQRPLWFSIQIDLPIHNQKLGHTTNTNFGVCLVCIHVWNKLYLYIGIGSSIPIRRADVFSKAPFFSSSSFLLSTFFSQFAKGYWVFSIVLEIQYPSEIEREEQSSSCYFAKHIVHTKYSILLLLQIFYKIMEKSSFYWNWRKKEEFLPIGHFSATLKIVL